MKAVIVSDACELELIDRPMPEVGEYDALIRVHACGICGTDVHIVHGGFDYVPGVVLGHELSGEVVEIGSKATNVKVGDRVTIDPNVPDFTCRFCRRGEINHCEGRYAVGVHVDGGYAEYCKAPAAQAYKVPDSVSLDEAAMAEPLACCVRGIDRAGIRPGDTVTILGSGSIGLMLLQLARASGASTIIVSEPDEKKRLLAARLGADVQLDPKTQDVACEVEELTGVGADVVIESAGRIETAELAVRLARPGGTILQFGVVPPDQYARIAPNEIFRKELTIRGSFINPFTHARAIDFLASKQVEVMPLITHRFSLEDAEKALETAQSKDAVKVLIVPRMRDVECEVRNEGSVGVD